MDPYQKFLAVSSALRAAPCTVGLLTKLHKNGGTTEEITFDRQLVCHKAARRPGSAVYSFKGIDLAALDRVFPFETFTVADWPNLYVASVGKRVPQGVGTALKVPLVLIDTDGSTFWKYAGPKVVGSAATLLTLYRGSQPGQGAIVDASEYTTSTATAPSGYQVVTHTFTREQLDFSGQPYVLEADYTLPGSRIPADEIARLLALFGISTDSASFTAAAAYDTTAGFSIDACYGGDGRTGRAIITDLCDAARAWLTVTSAGEWAINQDSPRASVGEFDTSCDLIDLEEYGDGDAPAKVTLFYRPKLSLGEDWSGELSRDTNGTSSEMQRHNPYIREHGVADRYVCYWQKRHNSTLGPDGGVAKATVHGVQIASGDRVTITDAVVYVGTKDFIAPGIMRPADANQLTLRAYDANVYTYDAGTLPSDATNGYAPDYSFTAPAAPSGVAIISQGTGIDADGKVRAWALVRATPPAVNWAKLTAQLKDTTTNEIYELQLPFDSGAGQYQAVIGNLPPNRAMQARAWATNANNVDGSVVGPTSFTTATSSAVPTTPTVSVSQVHSFQLDYSWTASTTTGAPIKEYVLELSAGGGAYVEKFRGRALAFKPTGLVTGTSYVGRVKAVDTVGNESAYGSSASFAPAKMIDDTYIVSQGVSGGSIANSSINRGRGYTGTASVSGTITNGQLFGLGLDVYAFFPAFGGDYNFPLRVKGSGTPPSDIGLVILENNSGADKNYSVIYRTFLA